LLIDDELSTRLVGQNRLKELGYSAAVAENGAKGLADARDESFDLILVDADLRTGVTGFEVCRRLKQSPQTVHVPVVLFSKSSSNREDAKRGFEAGCDYFLLKGDQALLDEVVRKLLRQKQQYDEQVRQIRALDGELRRYGEERGRAADVAPAEGGGREWMGQRPDGVLLVDADGVVRYTDRGAREIFGGAVEGKNLGRLAPATGLEAFVRDVRAEAREGFRVDLPPRAGRGTRSLTASVFPLVYVPGKPESGLRVVLLHDASRRKLASELIKLQDYTLPRREVGVLLEAARVAFGASTLVGTSPSMVGIRAQVTIAAGSSETVLITGETGTGKQHVARALHFSGDLAGPFVPVDVAALSAENLELELFGSTKGARGTGIERPGLLQQAQNGTVLLMESEALAPELQKKLVRVLKENRVTRVGGTRAEPIEVRLVFSSSRDLGGMSRVGEFSSDLYEILARLRIHIPPLRERREDVAPLAQIFLERYGSAHARLEISVEALWVLENYDWPGNVRELEACIKRACGQPCGDPLAVPASSVVEVAHLPQALRDLGLRLPRRELVPAQRVAVGRALPGQVPQTATLGEESRTASLPAASSGTAALAGRQAWAIDEEDPISLDHYEMKVLLRAIAATGGDKLGAAKLLKVGKSTLYRKLKRYGIK
jgi:DNA-binding NtrC family response regulator